jgi:hypothetical protein
VSSLNSETRKLFPISGLLGVLIVMVPRRYSASPWGKSPASTMIFAIWKGPKAIIFRGPLRALRNRASTLRRRLAAPLVYGRAKTPSDLGMGRHARQFKAVLEWRGFPDRDAPGIDKKKILSADMFKRWPDELGRARNRGYTCRQSPWWAGRMNQGRASVITIQNAAPRLSYAELAKRVEQKRAVEQVNLLEAKLNPAFLTRLEAAIESADAQQGVQPGFPIEV